MRGWLLGAALLPSLLAGCTSPDAEDPCPLPPGGQQAVGEDGTQHLTSTIGGLHLRVLAQGDGRFAVEACNGTGRTVWSSLQAEDCPLGMVRLVVIDAAETYHRPESPCERPFDAPLHEGEGMAQSFSLRDLEWAPGDEPPAGPSTLRVGVSLPLAQGGYEDGTWAAANVALDVDWP